MWIILFIAWIAWGSENSCDVSSLAGRCEQFPPESQTYIESATGRLLNPRLSPEQIRRLRKEGPRDVTPARRQRVTEIFEYAKRQMRAQILNGRAEHALSENERQLLKRIEITRFKGYDRCSASLGAVNENHEISICPSVANAPVATLVSILAHEIGHSIDSCACRHALLRRRPLSRQQVTDLLGPPAQIVNGKQRNPGPYENLRPLLNGELTNASGQSYTTLRKLRARPGHEELWNKILKDGFTRELPEIPEDQHPLHEVHKCLFGPILNAMGGKRTVAVGADGQDVQSVPGCTGRESEMSADVWGARVLAAHLKDNPPTTRESRLAALGPALTEICHPPAGDDMTDDFTQGSYGYRYNNIYLQDAGVRAALGCGPPLENSCLSSFDRAFRASGSPTGVRGEPASMR